MQAIIMAAGMGTRLGDITKKVPKALIPLKGIPLLGHQLKSLLVLSEVSKVVIVVGYLGEMVTEYLSKEFNDPRITVLRNSDYKKGPIITVNCAKDLISESFFVINVDHLFSSKAYKRVAEEVKSILIGSFNNRKPYEDERKIVLNDDGTVKLVKNTQSYYRGYTGLVAVGKRFVNTYFDAIQKEINCGNEYFHPDDLILGLSQRGVPLQIFDMSYFNFLEVDTTEDYANAEKEISKIVRENND